MDWYLARVVKAVRVRVEGLKAPEVNSGMSNLKGLKASEGAGCKNQGLRGSRRPGWEKSYPKGRGFDARAERWNFLANFAIFSV